MKVVAKKVQMLLEDGSGYRFIVEAQEVTPEHGWSGSLTIHSGSGMTSAEAVLSPLLSAARQLVHMLENEVPEEER